MGRWLLLKKSSPFFTAKFVAVKLFKEMNLEGGFHVYLVQSGGPHNIGKRRRREERKSAECKEKHTEENCKLFNVILVDGTQANNRTENNAKPWMRA